MAKKSQPKSARNIQPNAGIEAWYRTALQRLIREMSQDMLNTMRRAWKTATPVGDSKPVEAAGVMFRNAEGRILLLRRTDGSGWAFPGGGLEHGERPHEAARREAGEETGFGSNNQLFPFDDRVTNGVRFYTYEAVVSGAFDPILNHEHDAFVWIKPENIRCIDLHPGVWATLFHGQQTAQDIALDAKRPSIDLLRRALEKWGDIWVKRLDNLADKMAHEFANKNRSYTDRQVKQAFKEAGLTVEFKPTKPMLENYAAVVHENVNLIKSIPQKYLTDVQSTVWTNVMKGGDLKQMSEDIQHIYGVTNRRAAFIARDQNNKAKAVFERARDEELGVTKFVWVHSHAGKEPRPTHVRANGKTYSLAKGMYDADEGAYVFPGELINCRCTQRAILPGWDD